MKTCQLTYESCASGHLIIFIIQLEGPVPDQTDLPSVVLFNCPHCIDSPLSSAWSSLSHGFRLQDVLEGDCQDDSASVLWAALTAIRFFSVKLSRLDGSLVSSLFLSHHSEVGELRVGFHVRHSCFPLSSFKMCFLIIEVEGFFYCYSFGYFLW